MPDAQNWIQKHIVSRIYRGTQWREKLSEHAVLAKDFRYLRILGEGFRLVSLNPTNPCGHLNDKNGDELGWCRDISEAMELGVGTDHNPKANKPEHRIQAYLIREALQNELRLHQAFEGFEKEFDELIFVTDELNLEAGEDKLRADIIAVGGKNGKYFPVFIELKNKRALSELVDQLKKAKTKLWENEEARGPFAEFLNAVSGVDVDTSAKAKMMLIWPASTSGNESERVKEAREEGFLIANFEPSYRFHA